MESPEETFHYILAHIHSIPQESDREKRYSIHHKQQIQDWLGGRLAQDFDYGDLFMPEMIMRKADPMATIEVPKALIIQDDAYLYMDNALVALIQETAGVWKLRIALSICWGCFGAHSYPGGGCWGVLCNCCGGTGWESGDLEFYAPQPLPVDPALLTLKDSPKEVFLALQPIHPVLKEVSITAVSYALVRGKIAKIEVTTPATRYLALMNKNETEQWYLSAFLPLCTLCNGDGRLKSKEPCSACGGMNWGNAGELRYCRNYAQGWWEIQD
jgi:hypothetical protein